MQTYCDIYLIRHGETDWNVQGRLQGNSDIPLNAQGEYQALRLREKLSNTEFSRAYSSDLCRAKKTAALVLGSKEVKIIETAALREIGMLSWEGRLKSELKTWVKVNNLFPNELTKEDYLSYKFQEDFESYSEVYERLKKFIKTQITGDLSLFGSSILLSSHGGVLRSVLYTLDFHPALRWQIENCAYIKLRATKEGELSLLEYEGASLKKEGSLPF